MTTWVGSEIENTTAVAVDELYSAVAAAVATTEHDPTPEYPSVRVAAVNVHFEAPDVVIA